MNVEHALLLNHCLQSQAQHCHHIHNDNDRQHQVLPFIIRDKKIVYLETYDYKINLYILALRLYIESIIITSSHAKEEVGCKSAPQRLYKLRWRYSFLCILSLWISKDMNIIIPSIVTSFAI